MSEISTMHIQLGWTVQTKPYESFRVDIGLTANLDKEDNVNEVYNNLVTKIKKKITKEIENAMP